MKKLNKFDQLAEIKIQKELKASQAMTQCGLFFAFSNQQFTENKTPLQEGEKYVHIGAGAYLPKGNLDKFLNQMEQINKWYKDAIKAGKQRQKNIIYELCNHEAFYTGDIEDTLAALGSDYTKAEVLKVYNSQYKTQTSNL
jgi:hypothetical protein